MATNKHATIRYHALDQCFSNWGRRYYIEDLIEACNDALYEFTGIAEGIKRRQVFDDFRFMESDQGWTVPLDRMKDGKRVYYRYAERSFSIRNQPINESEAKQLSETLSLLTRFKGMPQFEWMDEILIRLKTAFNLKSDHRVIVGFEQNPYLKGLNFFSDVFNAIQFKRVLSVEYKGFRQAEASVSIFHPYYLKQYNNRWFVFGHNESYGSLSNLALDRIILIRETSQAYLENNEIDFSEFFEDAIGVTLNPNAKPEKILLQIRTDLWPYIDAKPIHGSQKIKKRAEDYVLIELTLQINYELVSQIMSFGENISVIAPEALLSEIKTKAKEMYDNYF